jgi:mediator of RNA polymerase II transcription subunit 14
VELLLDCIRVTVGPLSSLASAIRPVKMMGPSPNAFNPSTAGGGASGLGVGGAGPASQGPQPGGLASGPGRPGWAPSTLLPTDVSVLLRAPYWIRIVYRKQFAMDMRCFAGDQVWLQPAPPPRSGQPGAGGSLPCPQFRPFVMGETVHVVEHFQSMGLSSAENAPGSASGTGGNAAAFGASSAGWSPASGGVRGTSGVLGGARLNSNAVALLNRGGNMQGGSQASGGTPGTAGGSGRSSMASNMGMRGEYTALFGLGDDGGYGGAWVPLVALKRVLRGTLRYLGVLWLFAQFPGILKEVLGSILEEREGSLLNHDPEQPQLRFFIGYSLCTFFLNICILLQEFMWRPVDCCKIVPSR